MDHPEDTSVIFPVVAVTLRWQYVFCTCHQTVAAIVEGITALLFFRSYSAELRPTWLWPRLAIGACKQEYSICTATAPRRHIGP